MAGIFSTYSTPENRVTSATLAVLRSISLGHMTRLLGTLLEQPELELVRFENQPSKGGAGVPDGLVQASLRILLETKAARNAVRRDQLVRHLKRLDAANEATKLLLVLTPDDVQPKEIAALSDDRVTWASFAALDQGIDKLLDDNREVVSERQAFLLRELQKLLLDEGLLASANDVVVVAARVAWPEYQKYHA